MSKLLKPKEQPVNTITCTATSCFRIDGLLTVSVELQIVDGRVVSVRNLNAPDLPASSIGKASSSLWQQIRTQSMEVQK